VKKDAVPKLARPETVDHAVTAQFTLASLSR
jgi:hypothetical protein